MPACRVLINQPSSQGGIGDLFNFKLEPSLSLGCGSWGGNAVSGNIGVEHLLNYKTVAERRENMLWFKVPPKVYFKRGCTDLALRELKGKKRAFIVTDRFLFNSGAVDNITRVLDEIGVDHQVFFDVKPDPTLATINEAMAIVRPYEPDVIIALGGGCGRSGIQLAIGNAQNVLGLDPGTALNTGGLLVGQIALVSGQRAADEAVTDAGLFQTVVHNVQQHGQGLTGQSHRSGVSNSAGDVTYAVVNNTVYYVTFEGLSPTEFDAIIKAEILVDGSNDGACPYRRDRGRGGRIRRRRNGRRTQRGQPCKNQKFCRLCLLSRCAGHHVYGREGHLSLYVCEQ